MKKDLWGKSNLKILPFEKKHFTKRYISWLNDKDVVKFSEQRHQKHTRKTCQSYIKSLKKNRGKLFAIELLNRRHIGNISVHRNIKNSTAEIGILS